jgi:endonuclease/exonuclease/phosphatase family metal-dependent hydrolase
VKLLVWNIQQGGGPRRQRIAATIAAHNPDTVALIEFIPGACDPLIRSLLEAGLEHRVCTQRNGFDYALCVLSKTPLATVPSGHPLLDGSGLWLRTALPAHCFHLGVVHVPTKSRTVMKEYLTALVETASQSANDPLLLAGDFNTGIGPADGPLKNFGDVDRFMALQDAGFTDVWRLLHGDRSEHTWQRNGQAWRIDHALASSRLVPKIRSCRYSHDERLAGISDHSILLIDIDH